MELLKELIKSYLLRLKYLHFSVDGKINKAEPSEKVREEPWKSGWKVFLHFPVWALQGNRFLGKHSIMEN